jgi:hypothetical protein
MGPVGVSLALLVIALLSPRALWAKKPVPICTPLIPCSDSRGCPDLTIDPGVLSHPSVDVHTFAADDCAVVEGMVAAGTRRLILFSTQSNNLGPGALWRALRAAAPNLCAQQILETNPDLATQLVRAPSLP